MTAEITRLQLCVGHFEPMKEVEAATMITDFGMEGDRHATFGAARKHRQVLLMDEEMLQNFGLEVGEVRENITTKGIDLHSLPRGERLSIGDEIVLEITGFCDPCQFIEDKRPGLRAEMEDKRGMLTTVIQGGAVKVGDAIRVTEGAKA